MLIAEVSQLNELFNDVYQWQWSGKTTKVIKAKFNTDSGGFVEVFFERLHPDSENFEVGFKKDGEIKRSGEGDQFKIMATVIDVIKSFMQEHPETNVLTFTAKREGEELNSPKIKNRRAALYSRMLKRFADKLGYIYSQEDIGRMTEFVLVKKEPTEVEEGATPIFGRTGGKTVRKYRCTSGSRKGRIVAKSTTCTAPRNVKASQTMKKTRAAKSAPMAKKTRITKTTNPASRRLSSINTGKRTTKRKQSSRRKKI